MVTKTTPYIRSLAFKPDFSESVARFEAWWKGAVIDRPPVSLYVASSRPSPEPPSTHATVRERWFDQDYQLALAVARLENGIFLGDTLPVYYPNLGPELTATLYGCELEFSASTSWSTPVVHSPDEWARVAEAAPDFDQPYWRFVEEATRRAVALSHGRFLVGIADLHGNYDTLAALRDPQNLCMDVVDCPELLVAAGRSVARGYVEAFARLHDIVAAAGMGSTTWTPVYHEGAAYLPSCDFWCMVGNEFARDVILPVIVSEMQAAERNLFHLDGPGALRHLDLLLSLPRLDAIQWVYGDGHGPAREWIDVYRRIIRAGKSVQVIAEDAHDALEVLSAVGPERVWLTIGKAFSSEREAEEFLLAVGRGS